MTTTRGRRARPAPVRPVTADLRRPSASRERAGAALGVLAAMGLALLYVAVVGLASGPQHLADQARADWYWLAAIITAFGVQLALLVELRSRQRAHHSATTAAAGTGA